MTEYQPQQPAPQPPYQMAPPQVPYFPPLPAPPATQPKRRRWVYAAVAAAALVVGVVIGAASSSADTENTTASGSSPTAATVPQSCLDALDAAESLVHRGVVPALDAAADGMAAAGQFDVDGIEASTARLNALTPKVRAMVTDYNTAADECRSH